MPRKTEHKTNCICVTCQDARTGEPAPWVESDYQARLKAMWPPGRAKKSRAGKTAPKSEPDALKRLEEWMLKGFAWQAILGLGSNREPGVRLQKGLDDPYPLVMGKTLSAAIHAAIDQAQHVKRRLK